MNTGLSIDRARSLLRAALDPSMTFNPAANPLKNRGLLFRKTGPPLATPSLHHDDNEHSFSS